LHVRAVSENDSTRHVLQELLQTSGLRATVEKVPATALALLAGMRRGQNPPGAIILDEEMSEGTVEDWIQQARGHAEFQTLPILVLSSWENAAKCHKCELADGMLDKPLRQSQLLDAIIRVVASEDAESEPAPPPRPANCPPPVPQAARSDAKVLVAQDNEINQIVTKQTLAKAGYACDIVANGREALDALEAERYDIVLMDCQMPEMDGFEAVRRYREHERERGLASERLPIIALTANALSGDRERCLDAGMTDYLSKPIDPLKLLALLDQYLSSGQRSVISG
jgi:CheY-like chemotaxis protein